MRKLLLLALIALPVRGQGTVSGVSVEHTDRAMAIRYTSSAAISTDASRCQYDYDTVSLDRQTFQFDSKSANGGLRQCMVYDLTPATKVYVAPQVSDASKTSWSTAFTCTGTCTDCGSSDDAFFADSSGLDCDGIGQYPNFTTSAEDTDPTPTAPSTSAVLTPPTVDGSTHTVDGTCSNLAAQKDAAEQAASSGGTVEKLVLPAGVECDATGFELKNLSNGGKVLVTSSADSKLLPPPGAQIDATFHDAVGILTQPMSDFGLPIISHEANANGYYFENVEIGPPALDSSLLDPVTYSITDITSSVITVADTTGLYEGAAVFVDLTGSGVLGGYGLMQIGDLTGTTFKLHTGCSNRDFCGGTTVSLVGSCSSSCGTVSRWVRLPIAAHTSSNGNHALTISSHGLANFPNATITAGSGATITISGTPSQYQIGSAAAEGTATARVVHVEGTSGNNCDGLWVASGVAGSVITLARNGETPDCDSVTTGTVHAHKTIAVFQTSSDTIGDAEPRVFNYEVVDSDTIELLETSAVAGVTGGYVFFGSEMLGQSGAGQIHLEETNLSTSVEDVTFDRILHRGCLPYNSSFFAYMDWTENSALINSHIETCMFRLQNPVYKTGETTSNNRLESVHHYTQSPQTVDIRGSQGLVIKNNYITPQPFIFNDNTVTGGAPNVSVDDLTVSQNYFWIPDWTVLTTGSSRGLYFQRAFTNENKSMGCRALFDANFFKGNMSNFNQTAASMEWSYLGTPTAYPNGPCDQKVSNNINWKGATFLQLSFDTSTTGSGYRFNLQQRFEISNNLAIAADTPAYGNNSSAGHFLSMDGFLQDLVVANNTYAPERCLFCAFVTFGKHHGTGGRLSDNIFVGSTGSNSNRAGVRTENANNETPSDWAATDAGLDLFQKVFWRGTATDVGDTSEYDGNVHIPGIETSSSGTYAVKAASLDDSDTICAGEFNSFAKFDSLATGTNSVVGAAGTCSGNDVDSLAQRLDLVFESGTWQQKSTPTDYTGKGADLAALSDAQGFCGPVTVTADDDQFDLAFHAATTAEVYVDYVAWDTDLATTLAAMSSGTRGQTADGATKSKTFSATSLSAETQYLYRVWGGGCAKAILGLVTTAGTP